jgi:hypothetical protein
MATLKMTSRRAMAYQQRNRVRGLCVICPAPALLRIYIDPGTGTCVSAKRIVFCAWHWEKAQARRTHGGVK